MLSSIHVIVIYTAFSILNNTTQHNDYVSPTNLILVIVMYDSFIQFITNVVIRGLLMVSISRNQRLELCHTNKLY